MKVLGLKEEFIRQTGLVFVGTGLFHLFNLLYHLFMIRALPPTDYGHLNTLVSLFMMISVPSGTVQNTVARFFSTFRVQNRYHQAIELLRRFLVLMAIVTLSFFLLVILMSSHISSFLQISSRRLVILFGLSLVFSMILPILWGGLQGLKKFGFYTLSLISNSGLKLVFGILFIFLGFGILGAMSAVAVSYFVTMILSLFMIGVSLRKEKKAALSGGIPKSSLPSNFSEVYHYSFSAGLVLLCFMVLTNIDLILVKHFFTPIEAGYYSIAQMVGKAILILPIPVATVMFPHLFSSEGQEKKTRSILERNLKIAVFVCGGAVLCSLIFPAPIIKILSGEVYSDCLPLVGMFSVNMTFFSLTLILLYYHLSTPRRGFLYPLLLFTVMEVGLILLFHNTLVQVLTVVGIIAFCLALTNFYLVYHSHPMKGKELAECNPTMNDKGSWKVRDGNPLDMEGILSLRGVVFGEEERDKLDPRFWQWEFLEGPDGKAFLYIVEDQNKLIGHFADIPRRFSVQGEVVHGTLSLDLMVHPDYWRKGIFAAMGKYGAEKVKQESGRLLTAFPIRSETILGLRKIGWKEVAKLPVLVYPIRFEGILNRYVHFPPLGLLIGGIARFFYFLFYGLKKRKETGGIEIDQVGSLDEPFDDFWQKASVLYPMMGIRNRDYLNWRYLQHPTRNYVIYRAKKRGEMRGYLVLRKVDLLKFNSAVIVDLLALDEETLVALVEKGIQHSQQERADLLGFMVPQDHFYYKLLRKKGFLPSLKTFLFMIYSHADQGIFLSPGKWYVNWGDTDVI